MPLFNLDGLRYAFQSVQFCSVLIYKQVFFSLSTVVCLSPPLIFNEVSKWGRKKREYLSCFYLFICGTLYIDWKSHLLCIIRGHPIFIIAQRKLIQLTATFVCETWQRNRERQKEKKCATNFFSIFVWKIQCDRWRWLHRVWKQKQLSPWVSQWTRSTLILRKR